ncbi:signal peptidase I [Paenibacillus sp. R14(2021)]|uniref:signal peptidase I n=1 Tax=Paenibacillus sp. R14(2021) TaxID=2859228 RepID=UPI001C6126DF|nr:signal peptidase I [Paenibacillus sp. R14(2021)]
MPIRSSQRLLYAAAAIAVMAVSLWYTIQRDRGITDSRTPISLPKGVQTSGMLLVDFYSDGMTGKQGSYSTDTDGQLVVDAGAYVSSPPQRGDVVWFSLPPFDYGERTTPPKQNAARVIALPGERFSIREGQIYINGKRLSTFYGRILFWGQTEREFLANSDEKSCPAACVKTMKAIFSKSIPEMIIPEGSVYVLGDTSDRSLDSALFGPLSAVHVLGKVVGATGKPKPISNP